MAPEGSDDRDDGTVLSPDELDVEKHEEVAEIDDGRYVVSPSGKPRVDEETIEKQDWLEDNDRSEAGSRSSPSPSPPDDPPATGGGSASGGPASGGSTHAGDRGSSSGSTGSGDPSPSGGPPESTGGPSGSAAGPSGSTGEAADSTPGDRGSRSATDAPAEITTEDVSRWMARSFAAREEKYCFDLGVDIDGSRGRTRHASDDLSEAFEQLLLWYADRVSGDLPPEEAIGVLLASSDTEVEYPVQSAYAMLKRYGLRPDDSIADLLSAIRKEGSMTVPPSRDTD